MSATARARIIFELAWESRQPWSEAHTIAEIRKQMQREVNDKAGEVFEAASKIGVHLRVIKVEDEMAVLLPEKK